MLGFTSARSFVLATFIALGVAPSLGCSHGSHHARGAGSHAITVVGHGEVSARPDMARVTLGVESRATTVAEANRSTNERIALVIAAVRATGVAEADVRTSNYSISFERFSPPEAYGYGMPAPAPPPPPPPGANAALAAPPPPPASRSQGLYRVSNTIEIAIRDVNRVATVLDAAVATGANEVQGVSFDIDARAPLEVKVREEAVADARTRAQALASLHGKKLGPVISVSEIVTDVGRPMYSPMMMSRDASGGGAQIVAGEIAVQGQLQVVYAFEEGGED